MATFESGNLEMAESHFQQLHKACPNWVQFFFMPIGTSLESQMIPPTTVVQLGRVKVEERREVGR